MNQGIKNKLKKKKPQTNEKKKEKGEFVILRNPHKNLAPSSLCKVSINIKKGILQPIAVKTTLYCL